MRKKILATAVVFIAGLLVFKYYRASGPVVEVVATSRGTAIYAVYGTVQVLPKVSFSLHARTGGILKYSSELAQATNLIGFEVRTGQVLGEVFNESLDRDYAKAAAEWRAALERQKIGPPALPALRTQEAMVVRLERLVALSNVPPSEVEHAENDLTTSRELVREQEIEIERSTNIAGQIYNGLREQKEHCKFISPLDGSVDGVNGVNGEFVNEGSVPFVLISKSLFLEGRINEEDVGHVATQMKAAVKLYAYPDRDLSATVGQVLPTAANQRYIVNLTLDQPPLNLMAGETGEMNILSGTRENALLIPTRALLSDRVWVVADGIVKPLAVKTGLRNLERTEILDGLREGDEVVVADQDLLRPGLRVRTVILNQ